MNKKQISIITVVLNSEKTIEQTILSVVKQKYDWLEYIIIDGGSTDKTCDIVNKYINDIDYYKSEKDDGIYDAMNKGIEMAHGDIIGLINSDDWYEDNILCRVKTIFDTEPDVDAVYGDMTIIDKDNRYRINEIPIDDIWVNMFAHPTLFLRRYMYQKHGLYNVNYKIAADYELVLRMYSKGAGFYYLNENIAYFRSGGLSTKKRVLSAKEVRDISWRYLSFSGNPRHYENEINKRYYGNMVRYVAEMEDDIFYIKLLKICDINNLYLWGTGVLGRSILQKLARIDIPVRGLIDTYNSIDIDGFDIPLIRAEDFIPSKQYIFIASSYAWEIKTFICQKRMDVNILDVEWFFE